MGDWFEAQQFLDLYYIRRIEESMGRDYTKWHKENNPWEGMTIEEISHEADKHWKRTHPVKRGVESGVLVEAGQSYDTAIF
jgi:hypothetical protein